ncbi:hypothetical protein POW16_30265, partial [Raoultella planticola]|uniref:hypothetical protein n=1 Tax=Raoultella planticola TaxID=575 RepID=UPI002FF46BAC
LMMSLWDALRMNMMISYQELVRTFLRYLKVHGSIYRDTYTDIPDIWRDKPRYDCLKRSSD